MGDPTRMQVVYHRVLFPLVLLCIGGGFWWAYEWPQTTEEQVEVLVKYVVIIAKPRTGSTYLMWLLDKLVELANKKSYVIPEPYYDEDTICAISKLFQL